jgi:hypothetical protein
LNPRHNSASIRLAAHARIARLPAFAVLLCVVLAGCRRKTPAYTIPVAPQISLEPESDAAVVAPAPAPNFGPLPPVRLPTAPQRRRSGPKDEPAATAPAASEPPPADFAIGSLSTGQDAAPQIQQQARDMISSIQKRIGALSTRIADSQRREIRQVRHFLDQAQQAFSTGDTEGAKNLATKAGLLMDDLEKK